MQPRTSFVGREDLTAEVAAHVRTTQVVTLVGPGGIGKTRLALHVAAELEDEATDGVFVAELAQLLTASPASEVGSAVAAALGTPTFESAWEALHDATALLVLDNCEHVVDAVVETVEMLLVDRPELRILLTSREPIEADGEQIVVVGPLTQEETLRLLEARAESAGASFRATNDDAAALCRELDGLPLAVELAAPRLRALAAGDVRARLAESADVLRRTRGDERHRSLAATVAWSYELLTEDESAVFRHASVFPAAFGLDDITAVLGDDQGGTQMADCLDRLVTQSLLHVETGALGAPRYRMLIPIRQAAREWAVENSELADAQERLIVRLVDLATDMLARGAMGWDDSLVNEIFDRAGALRATGEWCLQHDSEPDRAFRLFLPLWATVHNSHIEGTLHHGEALLSRWPETDVPLWPEVAALAATAALGLGEFARSEGLALRALAASPDPGLGVVVATRALVLLRMADGDFLRAAELAEAGAATARAIGAESFARHLDNHRAGALLQAGDVDGAREIAAATDEYARRTGATALSGPALQVLAESHLDDDVQAGHRALDMIPGVVGSQDLVDGRWAAKRVRGQLLLREGESRRALRELADGLESARRAGERRDMWTCLRWIGVTLALHHEEHLETAAAVLAAADLCPATPTPGVPGADLLAAARALVGDGAVMVPADTDAVARALSAVSSVCHEVASPATSETVRPRLVVDGPQARIEWQGEAADLPVVKGLLDIATLLASPGREVHALALMGSAFDEAGTGPDIDESARHAYEGRLRELHADIAEAEADNDVGRLEAAQREFDEIVDVLSSALGLGGRDRRAGASAEKARSAVTWRIKAAIKRVEKVLPPAGGHLRHAIKTGGFCRYEPEQDPGWIVQV